MAAQDPSLLLQDLLSPPSASLEPRQIARLVSYHLSTLPLAHPHLAFISLIARYTALSPAIWDSPDLSGWDKHQLVYEAVRQGVLLRLDAVARPPTDEPVASTSSGQRKERAKDGGGWSARRSVQTFVAELFTGLWADSSATTEEVEGVRPLVRLAMCSGALAALQEWKRRKEKLWVGGAGGLGRAEKETGRAWSEWVQRGGKAATNQALASLPAWLAAQTVPFVHPETLAADWPAASLLNYLADSFSAVFAGGYAFSTPSLSADLAETPDGLAWNTPSPSHTHVTALTQAPLFVSLGPLSRAIGRTLEATALTARSSDTSVAQLSLGAIHRLATILLSVACSLSDGWSATIWSDITDDSSLSPSTRSETAPWTLLKSLLFAQTLVYSSLLEVVTSSSASEAGEPTQVQRRLASDAVRALGKTYFVALKFGQGGFKAWRAVLAGLVEVVAAPSAVLSASGKKPLTQAETLVRSLQVSKGTGEGGRHVRAVERAEATFWLNTAEQVMGELGDYYVEEIVLRGCRPYLDDTTFRDTFEAAHSVMLAVFSKNKRCVADVAPWYITLLLKIYPSLLSPTQLRFAFSTTIGAVSYTDDALAWWCIEELLARLEALPVSTEGPVSTAEPVPPPSRDDIAKAADIPAASEGTAVTPLETRARTLPRGAYLLTLIALLPAVNLVLFSPLLSHIERLVRQEPVYSDGRDALVEATFEQLGARMDAVKRKEATEWWLRRGKGLVEGAPVREDADARELEASGAGGLQETEEKNLEAGQADTPAAKL
ncbi:peroxisomal membrane protein [Rhodotorula toruloides]|uniref:Peroxisomal membrane protein n=1 Tax=Rhodotorula toruloides TaxID=5286 RepID=A0A511KBM1_RHOTO|nr:peroxisomal membrane protein [Rhodotorula toruloides]